MTVLGLLSTKPAKNLDQDLRFGGHPFSRLHCRPDSTRVLMIHRTSITFHYILIVYYHTVFNNYCQDFRPAGLKRQKAPPRRNNRYFMSKHSPFPQHITNQPAGNQRKNNDDPEAGGGSLPGNNQAHTPKAGDHSRHRNQNSD